MCIKFCLILKCNIWFGFFIIDKYFMFKALLIPALLNFPSVTIISKLLWILSFKRTVAKRYFYKAKSSTTLSLTTSFIAGFSKWLRYGRWLNKNIFLLQLGGRFNLIDFFLLLSLTTQKDSWILLPDMFSFFNKIYNEKNYLFTLQFIRLICKSFSFKSIKSLAFFLSLFFSSKEIYQHHLYFLSFFFLLV